MSTRATFRWSNLNAQAIIGIVGRLLLSVVAILSFFTFRVQPGSNGQAWVSAALWLMGLQFIIAPITVLLTVRGYGGFAVTASIIYDTVAVLITAHAAGGMNTPYPLLLATTLVGAGANMRRHPLSLIAVGLFAISLYLFFAVVEHVPALFEGALLVNGVGIGIDTEWLYSIFYLLSFAFIITVIAAANLRSNHLIRTVAEQSAALSEANAALTRSVATQSQIASQLNVAAGVLADDAGEQVGSSNEQATSVMEVSVTIEQLSQTAQQIADAARAVSQAAEQAMNRARSGQEAVRDSIIGIAVIRGKVNDIATRILALSNRAQRIGEVIDVINDIAAQTHLLSLNAAIESAEAGAEGKRFAVVAAEVKKLAQRASTAVREVRGLVTELQAASNTAVMATEDGMKETEKGVQLAHLSGDANEDIMQVVDRTSQLAAAIRLATQQQRTASAQVATTMHQIAEISVAATASSQRAAAAAARVSELASQLRNLQGRSLALDTDRLNLYSPAEQVADSSQSITLETSSQTSAMRLVD